MALGVTPLRVGQEAYWLDQIAHDRCEYYSGKGESPGWWAGSLAERVGLEGVAEELDGRRRPHRAEATAGGQRTHPRPVAGTPNMGRSADAAQGASDLRSSCP